MPRSVFSGALPPKKKYELQEIAAELGLNDGGTKDELVARLKKHLDVNQDTLEDNPSFTGLYTRRKKSVQPQMAPRWVNPPWNLKHIPKLASSTRLAPTTGTKAISNQSPFGRRVTTLDPVRESTPVKDLRDVSMYLKHTISPINSTPNQSPRTIDVTTSSSLPPLPPSPSRSSIEQPPKMSAVNVTMPPIPRHDIIQSSREHLADVRAVSITRILLISLLKKNISFYQIHATYGP